MRILFARYPTSSVDVSRLEKLNIFKNLSPDVRQIFVKKSKIIDINPIKKTSGELLLDNKIYILLEGNAFLSCIEKDGKKVIIDILKEGSIFGFVDAQKERIENCLYIEPFAKSSIKVCEFEKHHFLDILSKSPSLALYVFLSLTNRMSRLEKKIEEMTFLDLETRLLTELGRLGPSKITHERLAQILGVVRETISKTLARLRRSGIVTEGS